MTDLEHRNELLILFMKYWIVSYRSKRSSFQARAAKLALTGIDENDGFWDKTYADRKSVV